MSVWQDISLWGIYTISPTHCGIGQASGAVDLPIARETSTGFPILPATSLKGVARDFFNRSSEARSQIPYLFGKDIETADSAECLEAGAIAFTEARLIAFPVRSINRPFMHVTCPLILERFRRDLRALGMAAFLPSKWRVSQLKPGQAHVSDNSLSGMTMVLEDLVYTGADVGSLDGVTALSNRLSLLIPEEEAETRARIVSGLVVIPDADFSDLIQRVTPVRARTKLTDGKTTDKWKNPETGEVQSGNLWYEEYLPSDVLFVSFIGERRQCKSISKNEVNNNSNARPPALNLFQSHQHLLKVVQIGGNETVGHGICYWTSWSKDKGGNNGAE
jgi:CRISPR-associated protein Cmr4